MPTAAAAGIINAMVMRSELVGISWYIKCIGVWRERDGNGFDQCEAVPLRGVMRLHYVLYKSKAIDKESTENQEWYDQT